MSENKRSIQIADNLKWPKGKHPDKFRKAVSKSKDLILTGRVVSIDPASGSSSMPGWALFESGQLIESGTIKLDSSEPVQTRLNTMFYALSQGLGHLPPDVVIMEEIRGKMAHAYLMWACGVSAAAFAHATLLELPVSFWKAILPNGYSKADDTDAVYIGLAAIMIAKECYESISD